MVAAGSDGGRSFVSHAAQVCLSCKARKKKCDKALPSCGYCIRKRLRCTYSTPHAQIESRVQVRHRVPPGPSLSDSSHHSPSPLVRFAPAESVASLHVEIYRLIRSTGQFVDDVSARYFQGIHRYLPFISRARFYNSLITIGATPSAGFSVLLLAICVIISSPAVGRAHRETATTPSFDRGQLHLTAKSLLAQIQASTPVSVHLIQAALLLSLYEYAEGRPDDALATIASCSRMAYASRIHARDVPTSAFTPPITPSADSGIGTPASEDAPANVDAWLEAEEAANTWWGIVICERKYICDASIFEQPLITVFPGADERLPTEPEVLEHNDSSIPDHLPYAPVYSMEHAHIKAFGRAAQATWYLEQILESFKVPGVETRLDQLKTVDIALQKFLGVLMLQCHNGTQMSCEALTIAIRAFFTLHSYIIDMRLESDAMMDQTMDGWIARSHTALDTGVKMVLDIVETLEKAETHMFHAIALSYLYIIRAALNYIIRRGPLGEKDGWLRSAEDRLRASLEYFV
ncbi:hypothetical protein BU23DRAFT_604518 [Bimuria novae-zelandiae CBS 107.79]|uniref:Zn(2)-C6 fungal-type domain-containing protein n=1 Tax=Bimuria novae-zelandiae CBS 107.79 TaxID=1447943 RepID=A0A6A5UPP4_9PLEO|nr:hypothetical protein BU23DRAFT_604518 [Bimuria novae-zelandiae CBS 107.79]